MELDLVTKLVGLHLRVYVNYIVIWIEDKTFLYEDLKKFWIILNHFDKINFSQSEIMAKNYPLYKFNTRILLTEQGYDLFKVTVN